MRVPHSRVTLEQGSLCYFGNTEVLDASHNIRRRQNGSELGDETRHVLVSQMRQDLSSLGQRKEEGNTNGYDNYHYSLRSAELSVLPYLLLYQVMNSLNLLQRPLDVTRCHISSANRGLALVKRIKAQSGLMLSSRLGRTCTFHNATRF